MVCLFFLLLVVDDWEGKSCLVTTEEDGGCSCPSSTSIGEEDELVGSTAMGTGEDDDDCNCVTADEEARASDEEGNVLPSLEEDIRRRIAIAKLLLLF